MRKTWGLCEETHTLKGLHDISMGLEGLSYSEYDLTDVTHMPSKLLLDHKLVFYTSVVWLISVVSTASCNDVSFGCCFIWVKLLINSCVDGVAKYWITSSLDVVSRTWQVRFDFFIRPQGIYRSLPLCLSVSPIPQNWHHLKLYNVINFRGTSQLFVSCA